MDAGIIAAFKRRYRNFQLEEELSRDEVGEKGIYKANQLQGMRAQSRPGNKSRSGPLQTAETLRDP